MWPNTEETPIAFLGKIGINLKEVSKISKDSWVQKYLIVIAPHTLPAGRQGHLAQNKGKACGVRSILLASSLLLLVNAKFHSTHLR